jgi:glyoxylase I family protein
VNTSAEPFAPEDSVMRLLGIDHVVIRARDSALMERFYVEVLGCAVERRQDAIGLVQLRAGAQLIDLVDSPAAWAGWAARLRALRATTWTTCACG